ncbi:MAG: hypothetical protein COA45_12040 [Zetaproteobacteria bacterium]|nr:MAG: hypothetical protein COA45_12040 [Zetaproteobacteria bacterium]
MSLNSKILFLTHVGNMGGAEAKMMILAESLRDNSEVCMFEKGALQQTLDDQRIKHSTLEMPDIIKSFKREDGLFSAVKMMPDFFRFTRTLSRKSKQYDVITCMSQKSFVFSALAKPFTRKPIIWFMNDLVTKEHFNPLLIKFIILLAKLSADHVVVNSAASKVAWLDAGGIDKNLSVLYSGVDVDLFESAIEDKGRIEKLRQNYIGKSKYLVGTFGRLSEWKGQDVFLKSISQIDNVHGLIVGGAQFGEDHYEQYLKGLAQELGVSDRVTFTGHMDNIPELMSACDVIAHCSTSPEPFGRVIVEAMLAKTPIIASKAGGPEEIVIHDVTGYLYPLGDSEKLSKLIQLCLNKTTEKRQKLVISAYKRAVENFSSKAMNDAFSRILSKDK